MSDAAANLFYQQGCCPFRYPLFISFGRPTLFGMPPWVLQQRSCKLPSQSPGDPSSQMFLFLSTSWIDPGWDSTSKSRICRLCDKTLFTLLPCQEGQVPTRVRFCFLVFWFFVRCLLNPLTAIPPYDQVHRLLPPSLTSTWRTPSMWRPSEECPPRWSITRRSSTLTR